MSAIEEYNEIFKILNIPLIIHQKLGKGAFGESYSVINHKTNETFAVKFEKSISQRYATLVKESKLMLLMKQFAGFPNVYQLTETTNFTFILMDMLGPNLGRLLELSGGK